MGTRFMCTKGEPDPSADQGEIVANDERETELIFRTMRNTSRVAKNAISSKVVAMEKEGAKFEEVRELVAGARGKMVYATGDADEGIWSAGQVQGLINDIPSCAELVSRIMHEAEAIIRGRLDGMISGAAAAGRGIDPHVSFKERTNHESLCLRRQRRRDHRRRKAIAEGHAGAGAAFTPAASTAPISA